MTGDTINRQMNQNISPGVIVLTLAVLAIVFMVGFHLMSRTDTLSMSNPVSVSGGLVQSIPKDTADKIYSR